MFYIKNSIVSPSQYPQYHKAPLLHCSIHENFINEYNLVGLGLICKVENNYLVYFTITFTFLSAKKVLKTIFFFLNQKEDGLVKKTVLSKRNRRNCLDFFTFPFFVTLKKTIVIKNINYQGINVLMHYTLYRVIHNVPTLRTLIYHMHINLLV